MQTVATALHTQPIVHFRWWGQKAGNPERYSVVYVAGTTVERADTGFEGRKMIVKMREDGAGYPQQVRPRWRHPWQGAGY